MRAPPPASRTVAGSCESQALRALDAIWPSTEGSPEAQALRFTAQYMLSNLRCQGFPVRTLNMTDVANAMAKHGFRSAVTGSLKQLFLDSQFFKVTQAPGGHSMLNLDMAALLLAAEQASPVPSKATKVRLGWFLGTTPRLPFCQELCCLQARGAEPHSPSSLTRLALRCHLKNTACFAMPPQKHGLLCDATSKTRLALRCHLKNTACFAMPPQKHGLLCDVTKSLGLSLSVTS